MWDLAPVGDQHVVAVMAHPDDAELMCYGTLRRWRQWGATTTVIVVTQGVNGVSVEDDAQGMRLGPQDRIVETLDSFVGTGIEIECLGFIDGDLSLDRALISAIEVAMRSRECTTLLTHKPAPGNDHQDHHTVAAAAVNAAARVPTCTAILHGEPHTPGSGFTPSVVVDITEFIDDKVAALKRHQTQAGRWYLSEEYTRHRAANAGWRLTPAIAARGGYYEAFECSLLLLSDKAGLPGGRGTTP